MIVCLIIKEKDKMIIIDLIKELMYQQNQTIRGLADETELDYVVIEDIVLREITPTPDVAKQILWVLGIKLEDVLMLY